MLTKLNPALSAPLLSTLSAVRSGEWIAVTSLPVDDRSVTRGDGSLEEVADAIFSFVPVSRGTSTPLVAWLGAPDDDAHLDAFFAFQGIVRDAERRTLEMARLEDLPSGVFAGAAAIVTVPSTERFAFFVCVGQGEHEVSPLVAGATELAA